MYVCMHMHTYVYIYICSIDYIILIMCHILNHLLNH